MCVYMCMHTHLWRLARGAVWHRRFSRQAAVNTDKYRMGLVLPAVVGHFPPCCDSPGQLSGGLLVPVEHGPVSAVLPDGCFSPARHAAQDRGSAQKNNRRRGKKINSM